MSAKDRIRQAPVHSALAAKGQSAIRDRFRASHDRTGNLPLFPANFPDQLAPIVRVGADGERELVMARWGYARTRRGSADRAWTVVRGLHTMARCD
jgi:putative SOS response-associated peptidase YedK